MSTPSDMIPTPEYSDLDKITEIKDITANLVKKYSGNIKDVLRNFFNEAVERSSKGQAPNANFGLVANDLSTLFPLYENLEKLKSGKAHTGNKLYDNLIYDNASQMNSILYNQVYDVPDPVNLTPEQEKFEANQALIKLQNKLPHVSSKKARDDILWNINLLNNIINPPQPQMGMGM